MAGGEVLADRGYGLHTITDFFWGTLNVLQAFATTLYSVNFLSFSPNSHPQSDATSTSSSSQENARRERLRALRSESGGRSGFSGGRNISGFGNGTLCALSDIVDI